MNVTMNSYSEYLFYGGVKNFIFVCSYIMSLMVDFVPLCLIQVEEIVDVGTFLPEDIHLPSIYVDRIILGENYEKRIQVRNNYCTNPSYYINLFFFDYIIIIQHQVFRNHDEEQLQPINERAAMRRRIIMRTALEFRDGMYSILVFTLVNRLAMHVQCCS